MKVDIIITTYNRLDSLKATMESFFKHTDLDDINCIIIADDGSTDGTRKYIKELAAKHADKITLSNDTGEHLGLVKQFNAAYAMTQMQLVCEVQDDVGFSHRWLESQIEELNKRKRIDFVTGFDAREHKAFQVNRAGHCVKHSSRFTQLMAYRSTWSRWFPMLPDHNFPTPCTIESGRCVGSNIDMKLSNMRKNDPNGQTKFLVLPGLVEHTAEQVNSTWRKDYYTPPKSRAFYSGGLRTPNVERYWRLRSSREGDIAVGFANKSDAEQVRILKTKQDFIRQHMDFNVPTIDYGCGVGKFAPLFDDNNYLGLDITQAFIRRAKEDNKGKTFIKISDPTLKTFARFCTKYWKQFFTANVLQHNCDATVFGVLNNLRKIRADDLTICLYENTHHKAGTEHMCFREVDNYISFISDHFTIKQYSSFDHVVHGEKHSFIKVSV